MKYISRSLPLLLLLIIPTMLSAQESRDKIEGVVKEAEGDKSQTIIGANVYWSGTTIGTVTDVEGRFSLDRVPETNQMVISFIGFEADTLNVAKKDFVAVSLSKSVTLSEVEIEHRRKTSSISYLDPKKVEHISEKELMKAACCNLSESFETNPSIDVSFTDAVTGTRQIQMLGLAGPYTQINRENMPDVRGLSAIYGLLYVPGTWVESMQLTKGAGSVVNGFESIAGQINVELRKPEDSDRLFVNLYGNESSRVEANVHATQQVSKRWGTTLLMHGKNQSIKYDRNNDGFLDVPLGNHFIGLNRWEFHGAKAWHGQVAVKATYIDTRAGQVDFSPAEDEGTDHHWGMTLFNQRWEGWAKLGKVFVKTPWRSFGFQVSGVDHIQRSYFGTRLYNGNQRSFYSNMLYQSIIGSTNHKFITGLSFQYDNYDESLGIQQYERTEAVPGAFFEYSYTFNDDFSAVLGLRGDYHNLFGAFVTPRLHLRYAFSEKTVLRASAGRGQRTASIIAENIGLLSSRRNFVIEGDPAESGFGLEPEVAWNYGLNLTHNFKLDYRGGAITFDFYRTDFVNQVVVDMDQNTQAVHFYNLKGQSFSNSFQAQVDYELVRKLDIRLAYRWYDVRTTYNGKLMDKPLLSTHRAFGNLAYEARKGWKFDYTLQWQGKKRIPNTGTNPLEYRLAEYSPSFFVMNTQITKSWKETFEIYAGVENLLNYTQDSPILAADDPFGPYFDASMVWGPVFGRGIYAGLRWRLK